MSSTSSTRSIRSGVATASACSRRNTDRASAFSSACQKSSDLKAGVWEENVKRQAVGSLSWGLGQGLCQVISSARSALLQLCKLVRRGEQSLGQPSEGAVSMIGLHLGSMLG